MTAILPGIDISNLQGHPDTWPSQPWYPAYQAAQFVLVQAIEPPAGFAGHDFIDPETGKRGYTGVQLRQAVADGKKVGVYAWVWMTLPNVYEDVTARFATVPPSVKLDIRPWDDIEDETGAGVELRQHSVNEAKRAADDFAASRGLPPSGGYSRDEYIADFLGGYWPDGWKYWQASYGGNPEELVDMRPVRQYADAPLDEDSMLESEIDQAPAAATDPSASSDTPAVDAPAADPGTAPAGTAQEVGDLVNALAYVCDTIGDQLDKIRDMPLSGADNAIADTVKEMARVRIQFLGPRS